MDCGVRFVITWLLPLTELFCVGSIVCFLYTNLNRFVVHYEDSDAIMSSRMKLSLIQECEDIPCVGVVSEEEKVQYDSCYNKTTTEKMARKFGPVFVGKCHFQSGISRYPVALGSFQGSGNTWLRGLLEAVTGICTGSVYCDVALRTKGFSGEGVQGPSVLVIKSHTVNPLFTNMEKLPLRIPNTIPVFGAAIVLIRNPRNAMVAEWHREKTKKKSNMTVSNHFLYVGEEYFGLNPEWNKYVMQMAERWKHHICGWLVNGRNNPLHIVKFEDLKDSTLQEITKLLSFYGGTTLPLQSITASLHLGYTLFYRNHTDIFHHFTSAQEKHISEIILSTISVLKEHYDVNSHVMTVLHSYINA